jgi:hypothetical protein
MKTAKKKQARNPICICEIPFTGMNPRCKVCAAEKAERRKYWHPTTGKVHSNPDCTSAIRHKWDLIDITEAKEENVRSMPVSCKRCLKASAPERIQ